MYNLDSQQFDFLPGRNPKQGIENVLIGKVQLVPVLFKQPPKITQRLIFGIHFVDDIYFLCLTEPVRPPPERLRILVMFIMMTPALRPTPGGPKLGSSSITLYEY